MHTSHNIPNRLIGTRAAPLNSDVASVMCTRFIIHGMKQAAPPPPRPGSAVQTAVGAAGQLSMADARTGSWEAGGTRARRPLHCCAPASYLSSRRQLRWDHANSHYQRCQGDREAGRACNCAAFKMTVSAELLLSAFCMRMRCTCHKGSHTTPSNMPTNSPRNCVMLPLALAVSDLGRTPKLTDRPVCHSLKSWLFSNTMAKACPGLQLVEPRSYGTYRVDVHQRRGTVYPARLRSICIGSSTFAAR